MDFSEPIGPIIISSLFKWRADAVYTPSELKIGVNYLSIRIPLDARNKIYLAAYLDIVNGFQLAIPLDILNSVGNYIRAALEVTNKIGYDAPLYVGVDLKNILASNLIISELVIGNSVYTYVLAPLDIKTKIGLDAPISIPVEIRNSIVANVLMLDLDLMNSVYTYVLAPLDIKNMFTYELYIPLDIANRFLSGLLVLSGLEISNRILDELHVMFDTISYRVYVDGADVTDRIKKGTIEVNQNETEYCNTFKISFADFSLYQFMIPDVSRDDERVRIEIENEAFEFMLEERSSNVAYLSETYAIWGRSRAAILDKPHSHYCRDGKWHQTDERDYLDGMMAEAAIASILAYWNISINVQYGLPNVEGDYGMCDYYIPPQTLSLSGKTPLEIINEIVKNAGCIVRSGPINTIIIRKQYPDMQNLDLLSYQAVIDDFLNTFSYTETNVAGTETNAVLIENSVASTLSGSWELDVLYHPNDAPKWLGGDVFENAYLRLYLVPLQPYVNYTVDTTDGSAVYIKSQKETIEDEIVEFDSMIGLTKRGIKEIIKYEWLGDDGGSITIRSENGSELLMSNQMFGAVARITYVTQYDVWLFFNINVDMVKVFAISNNP